MEELIPYLIKSTSILLVLLVYYKLFLRKQTFFRLNRIYLLSALLIATVTPFISIEMQAPAFTPEAPHPVKEYMSNLLEEVYIFGNYHHTEKFHLDFSNVLFLIYCLGIMGFICRYMLAFIQIHRLKHDYPGKRFHGIHIIFLPAGQPAFSYFNNLFICSGVNQEDKRKIFEHEKIHIREGHSLDLILAEIICISNWFNPLVWIFKHAIMENHEYIADRQVIRRYHTGSYLELLIRQTLKGAFSFSNYFSCTNLKKRTIMMTKKQSRKYLVLSFIPITAFLITLLYGFSCYKIEPQISSLVTSTIPEATLNLRYPPQDSLKKATEDQIFMVVDEMPDFPQGSVVKWISQNIKYPAEAIQQRIQGKVYVKFIVEKDGKISDVRVSRGVNPLLDQEAVRVIKKMPAWKPGKQKGQPVRVSYTLPINFALSPNLNEKKLDSTSVFIVVEQMPVFFENPNAWISKNIKYPAKAIEQKIQGKVYVDFIIEKDGSISNVKVIRGVNPLLDQEAIRVIKAMPKWTPGKQRGQAVRVKQTLPIGFSLAG